MEVAWEVAAVLVLLVAPMSLPLLGWALAVWWENVSKPVRILTSREWEEEGVTQTQAKCGHAFCLTCVVSVCNMTPPRELGTCPMCRADVALGDLVRVERTGKARNEEEEN